MDEHGATPGSTTTTPTTTATSAATTSAASTTTGGGGSVGNEMERRRRLGLIVSCGHCGATNNALMICSGCKAAFFCNQTCQRQAWKSHQPLCWRHGPWYLETATITVGQQQQQGDGDAAVDNSPRPRTTPQGETFLTVFAYQTIEAGAVQVTGNSLRTLGFPDVENPATTNVYVVNEMKNNNKSITTMTVRNDIVAHLCGIESLEALQAHPILSGSALLTLSDKSKEETMDLFLKALGYI